jgi:hypothetical protein
MNAAPKPPGSRNCLDKKDNRIKNGIGQTKKKSQMQNKHFSVGGSEIPVEDEFSSEWFFPSLDL